MKKLFLLVYILSMLAWTGTATATNPCYFIKTTSESEENEEKHYINPREVSSLTAITDPNNMGNINRYVIVIKMNNADFIVYGRYWAERNRNSIIQYLINTITTCNNQ